MLRRIPAVLKDEQYRWLRQEAERRGVSVSALIRETVETLLRRRILVDTSALFALVDADDPHHDTAREIAVQYRNAEYVLLNLVWVETITLVKRALGSRIAIEVGKRLLEVPPFVFYPVFGSGRGFPGDLDVVPAFSG